MFIEVSPVLKKLAKFFPENLYIVGGYVRNKLLGLKDGDVDLASCVSPEDVSRRLGGSEFSVKVKNLKLGSILISTENENFEYTAFRKEEYSGGEHCPSKVVLTDKIEDDAKRRDFSVNAIYYNINKDEVVDLFHGIIDTQDKILRTTIEPEKVFENDGERILRMVRIAGQLNFTIEKQTLLAAKNNVDNLGQISGIRKGQELEKILYCDKVYGIGNLNYALKMLNTLGIWKCFGLSCESVKFNMAKKTEDRVLGLLIDIVDSEKPACLQSFLEEFLKNQFGMSSQNCEKIFKYLAGYYNALSHMNNKEFFFKYFSDWAVIYGLLGSKSKHVQNKYNFFYQYIIEHQLVISKSDLKIDENDLSENFPQIDKRRHERILSNLLSKVFDGKISNEKDILLKEIKKNLVNF